MSIGLLLLSLISRDGDVSSKGLKVTGFSTDSSSMFLRSSLITV